MTQEHRFRLPKTPCSNVETVLLSFNSKRMKKLINEDTFQVFTGNIREGNKS